MSNIMNKDVRNAITSRRSVRQFLSKDVSKGIIEEILNVAARAPSGTNIQPWNVHVLTGKARNRICKEASSAFLDPKVDKKNDRLHYMENFRDPYISRRRKVGWDLYALLDIKKGDYEKTKAFHVQNFNFFNAPVGLLFTIEKDLGWMSWLDYGMFLQNICIAARGFDLDTCPQAAWGQMHKTLSPMLNIKDNHIIHCGISLGYVDPKAEVNKLKTIREDLSTFTTFHEK
ncbi:nitroreductase family protein [Alphaproteobacteria bacterium]|nr:nitroreductase family protein [Alphaproteobacteria bacterium]